MATTAIIVPGRKLLPDGGVPPILDARVEAAVQLCLKNIAVDSSASMVLVLSGGKVSQSADELARLGQSNEAPALGELQGSSKPAPPTSEAEAMHRLALEKGIPKDLEVLLDTESVNTLENAVLVRRLVEPRHVTRLVLVNSSFHMPRTKQTFELVFEGVDNLAISCVESSDEALTAAERERENAVEPAMIERLPAHARIYRRHLSGELTLEEARRRFFQRDEVHSDVWLLPIPDPDL
eukprot:TRINITY_DN21247_c0_g1_i1.p1 TRINITY_DN21247_c0_g1~~TRINITY_DN21247_c0_g1_i1.p1  ORF type:complete len:248 (+),score=49.98 TRINITY_DN21247_c0_g1_i1:31-744(+)